MLQINKFCRGHFYQYSNYHLHPSVHPCLIHFKKPLSSRILSFYSPGSNFSEDHLVEQNDLVAILPRDY